MSLPTGAVRARVSRLRPESRSRLSVVPPRVSTARSGPFVMLVAAILVLGLVGLLMLNLSMQKGSFRLAALQDRATALQTREQGLDLKVDRLSSSHRLAAEAIRMGMVPNPNPVFLDLSDGSVIGDPTPARPRAVPLEPVAEEPATPDPAVPADGGATSDDDASGDPPGPTDTDTGADAAPDAGGQPNPIGRGR